MLTQVSAIMFKAERFDRTAPLFSTLSLFRYRPSYPCALCLPVCHCHPEQCRAPEVWRPEDEPAAAADEVTAEIDSPAGTVDEPAEDDAAVDDVATEGDVAAAEDATELPGDTAGEDSEADAQR